MEVLRTGKVKNEDLAEWFGTNKQQLSNKKSIWLKKLATYCEFKPCYGGVEITVVYKYTYVKNHNRQVVKEHFDEVWDKSGLDSCSNVANQIYAQHADELTCQPDTTYKHTCDVRSELYGDPTEKESKGEKGTCSYVWCKKNKQGKLVYLTDEEERIKKELLQKWFGSNDEKTIIVQEMVENGELDTKDAWDCYSKLISLPHSYSGFMSEFKDMTGVQLVKGTSISKDCNNEAGGYNFENPQPGEFTF